MKYRLGLDVGIASIGWCVIEVDNQGEPLRIKRLSSRIFEKAETPDKGESPAMARRIARGARRRLRRRALRIETAKKLFFMQIGEIEVLPNKIYELRAQALDEKISAKEFGAVLLCILKHRGFKSNRKAERTNKDVGALLSAISYNAEYRREKGYRTVGEMLAKDDRFVSLKDGKKCYMIRNKSDQYDKTISQDELAEEVKILFLKQREFNNQLASEEIEEKYLALFCARREFDEGPGEPSPYKKGFNVGRCVFEKDEQRAPKASYTFEYVNALIKLNNLRINNLGEERALTEVEKNTLLSHLNNSKKGEITFAQIKKLLDIEETAKFNALTYSDINTDAYKQLRVLKVVVGEKSRYLSPIEKGELLNALIENKELNAKSIAEILNVGENCLTMQRAKQNIVLKIKNVESAKFVSLNASKQIINCLNDNNKENIELLDQIALELSMNKSDAKLNKAIKENPVLNVLSEGEIDALMGLSFSKFGSLSIKALKNIRPYLEKGMRYDESCSAAGYDFRAHNSNKSKLLNTLPIRQMINEINAPVVKRAISQTIKVINSVIREYGSPVAVNIELARELSKNFEDRMRIKRDNDNRAEENQKIYDYIRETFGIRPKGIDIVKYRLYEEQFGKCAYSQAIIDVNKLFEPTYLQIDHIIPYSRSYNDSYNNKVLVLFEENQKKKNLLPYEYFGKNEERWAEFESFVKTTYKTNPDKMDTLLRKTFSKENEKEWQSRSLNDTKYISRFMYNLIKDCLLLNDNVNMGKKRVRAVKGAITSYLRKMWGIEKVRTDGDLHHAKDAAVVACVTDGIIKTVTEYNKGKELIFRGQNNYTNLETGEILSNAEYDEMYGIRLKQPYFHFSKELKLLLSPNPKEYKNEFYKMDYEDDEIEELTPVFVSRMPVRKAKGRMHKDTIKSAKKIDEGIVISKTDIRKLKLNKDGEIEGYYNKEDDKLLYNALVNRLKEFNGDGQKAFEQAFYKPKSDGTIGNLVKKVKIEEKTTLEVKLDKMQGAAANSSIVRTDIFYKDKKYYSVPVYVADVYKKATPNKAIEAHKPYAQWRLMDDSYKFLYSLYPNDLIYIEHSKEFNLYKNDETKEKISMGKGFFYYKGINISSGKGSIDNHDNSYSGGVGLKTLALIKKCAVDVLGNISFVGQEKRQLLEN